MLWEKGAHLNTEFNSLKYYFHCQIQNSFGEKKKKGGHGCENPSLNISHLSAGLIDVISLFVIY